MIRKDVILYGAGRYVEYFFSKQKENDSDFLTPQRDRCVCIADSDVTKHNKLFYGLPIMSIQQALEDFPEADIYITLGFPLKYTVLAWLTDTVGIDKNRILNYELVEKYPSCLYLQGYVNIRASHLTFCYNSFNTEVAPIISLEDSLQDTVERFINVRDVLIQKIRNGEECSCSGCKMIQNKYWALPQNKEIGFINFLDYRGCNLKCKFCDEYTPLTSCSKETFKFGYEEFFQHLKSSQRVSSFLKSEIYPGEITVHPRRQEIFEAIRPYYSIIYTNGVIYSNDIAEILSDGRNYVFVSLDSGTRETYHKIKGVDAFDKVYDNLKKYSQHGAIELKYIIIMGDNDNDSDTIGFTQLCKDVKARLISLSRNYHMGCDITDAQVDFTVMFYIKLYEEGINVTIPYWQYSTVDNKKLDEALAKLGYIRKGN